MASKVMEFSGRTLEKGAKIGNGAVFRNLEAAYSTMSDIMFFYQTGERLCYGILPKVSS